MLLGIYGSCIASKATKLAVKFQFSLPLDVDLRAAVWFSFPSEFVICAGRQLLLCSHLFRVQTTYLLVYFTQKLSQVYAALQTKLQRVISEAIFL